MINRYCDILYIYTISHYITMYIGRHLLIIDHIINIVLDFEIIAPLFLQQPLDDCIIRPNRVQNKISYTYTHTHILCEKYIFLHFIRRETLLSFSCLSFAPPYGIVRHRHLLYARRAEIVLE